MAKKIVRRKLNQSPTDLSHLHPILQRVYAMRNIGKADDLQRELIGLLPYEQLLGIDIACDRLYTAIRKQQRIIVVGDFDVDGATSSAVAVSALRQFGAEDVHYLVPNRFAYGYGLTANIVDVAARQEPDLIITVDNGIASHAGVTRANELGIDVIITDHHLPGEQLPDAVAIVNPNQPHDCFPSKCLAGVGVIFYVMIALRRYLQEQQWFHKQNIKMPNLAQFLDLVALGTVADVVSLDKNNRILVYQGINRIRARHTRPGILALLQVAGRDYATVTTADLGFAVGPRLNAAGRLDDMSLGISCLLSNNPVAALDKAKLLDKLNRERRAIEKQMQHEAFTIVKQLNLEKSLPKGLCLYQTEWHQGVIGLVASRVKEKMNRPVIAFAKAEESMLKGSARSIKGIHIRNIFESIANEHPELLSKFGGHAMAAGLSIREEHFEQFSRIFAAEIAKYMNDADLAGFIETDGELKNEEFTLLIAELLQQAGPWGQGFPEPLFDGQFRIIEQRIVGQRHLKMLLQIPESEVYVDAIAFNVDREKWPNSRCDQVHLAYRLDVNKFHNRKKLQLVIEEMLVANEVL